MALIIGVHGLCRRKELHDLTIDNVEDHGTCLNFGLDKTKYNKSRDFSLTGELCNVVRKYLQSRPSNYDQKNVFLRYQNGKCCRQIMGIHTIGQFPKSIATFLQLPNPELYTGHAFRRSGATTAAEAGLDFLSLMKLGGWQTPAVARSYVDKSNAQKTKIASIISKAIIDRRPPSTIIKAASETPSTASQFARPSTSREDIPVQTAKRLKTNTALNIQDLIHYQGGIPKTNQQLMNVQPDVHQNVQIHLTNCSNFKIFGPPNKENSP